MNKKRAIVTTLLLTMIYQQTIQAEELASNNPVTEYTSLTEADLEPATMIWLELQRSGSQASKHQQTLAGPVMQKVYDRYKESFSRPIPQMTEQDARKIK